MSADKNNELTAPGETAVTQVLADAIVQAEGEAGPL